MQQVLSRYARCFNSKSNRMGHVFQGRFHAVLCKDRNQFIALVRYIHNNPVRAGLVERSEEWAWSSRVEAANGSEEWLTETKFPVGDLEVDMSLIEPIHGFARSKDKAAFSLLARNLAEEEDVPVAALIGGRGFPGLVRIRRRLMSLAAGRGFSPSEIARELNCSRSLVSKVLISSRNA